MILKGIILFFFIFLLVPHARCQQKNFQKQFHPSGNAMEPFVICRDKGDGYFLSGNYYIPSANNFVTRSTSFFHVNANGCVDWAKSMKEAEQEVIQSAIATADSGFLISAFPYQSQQDNYPGDLHIYKLDKAGNALWARSYAHGASVNNYYSAMYETADFGFVLEMGSFSYSGFPSSLSIIKISAGGNFIWGRSLAIETNAFYNVGGILEKGNMIYASGSISQGNPPFNLLRSFLIQLDETTGEVIRTVTNDPVRQWLTFTDIHLYGDGLIMNSYGLDLENQFHYFDQNGNYLNSLLVLNPYGALNGKGNLVVSGSGEIYFHQSSGNVSHKDIIMRIGNNQQIAWQYDFSTAGLNFSAWNQLVLSPDRGVAGIGTALLPSGFNTLTFLKTDSLAGVCNSGQTALQLTTGSLSQVPMNWVHNDPLVLDLRDIPHLFKDMNVESRLVCPGAVDQCDSLTLTGPQRICKLNDSATYQLHYALLCTDSVKWFFDGNAAKIILEDSSQLQLIFKKEGSYSIRAEKKGCDVIEDSILVNIGENISAQKLPNDTVYCSGSTLKLNAGPGFTNYLWQDGSQNPETEISASGTYWVKLTDSSGCEYTDTIQVDSTKSHVNYLPPDSTICSGEKILLKPLQEFTSYSWSTGENTEAIQVKDPGKYILEVQDHFGCRGIDSIRVETRICKPGLFFPNAFTPNQDGRNDFFRPRFFVRPVNYHLSIYNRWGQKVFESDDPVYGWNGRMRNREQETGMYIWFCTYQPEGEKTIYVSGNVLLLR